MTRRQAHSPAKRAEALRIAGEQGAAEASRITGIPAATIRAWMSRSRQLEGPGDSPTERRSPEALRQVAERLRRTAERARARAHRELSEGKASAARDAMVAAGVAIDKARAFDEAADLAAEGIAKLSQGQAKVIAGLIERVMVDLGVSWRTGSAIARLVAFHARVAQEGESHSAPADLLAAARAELRAVFEPDSRPPAGELEEGTSQIEAHRREQPALPECTKGDGADRMAGPV